jgi:hypothetical protein
MEHLCRQQKCGANSFELGRQAISWGGKFMHVERDSSGNFVLDPAELAVRFALTPGDFRSRMRQGLVVSTVEIGLGNEDGTCRLSLRLGNRLWRAVIDAEDRVTSETLAFVRGKLLRRDGED